MNRQLEILSRYLPYEVEVEFSLEEPERKRRGSLRGLTMEVAVIGCTNGVPYSCEVHQAKPILYVFEDLTATINGIVPAVEIAKLASPEIAHQPLKAVVIKSGNIHIGNGDDSTEVVFIDDNYDLLVYNVPLNQVCGIYNQVKIHQFLIRNHFAVGLNPHEYIRKSINQ